jgi:hypothetical protein
LQAAANEFSALKLGETPDGFLIRVQLACVLRELGHLPESQALAEQCRATADALKLTADHPRVRIRDACLRLDQLLAAR